MNNKSSSLLTECILKHIRVHVDPIIGTSQDYLVKDNSGELVTQIDLKMNDIIISEIRKIDGDATILSEELNKKFIVEILGNIYKITSLWIVDPIDGTSNITLGIPIFSLVITHMTLGIVVTFPPRSGPA